MNFIQHPSNNGVLGAPPGMTIDQCRALPVTHTELGGTPAIASFWQPSDEELAMLNQGKPVVIMALGDLHPPVAVGVEA